MIVFFRNVLASTRYDDIVDFVEPALKGGLLRKSGRIERVQMLIIKDPSRQKLEYHALVRVESDGIAGKAIKKLNKHPLLGRKVEVREYVQRRWQNDRREHPMPHNYVLPCERKKDRRRDDLEKVIVDHDSHGQFKYTFL